MFGIDLVGTAWRVGGAGAVGVWGAHHFDDADRQEHQRKLMGLVGVLGLAFARKAPASVRPAVLAAAAGSFAIYVKETIDATRAGMYYAKLPDPGPVGALWLGVKSDVKGVFGRAA